MSRFVYDPHGDQWVAMATPPEQIVEAVEAQRPGPARGRCIDTDAFLRAVGAGLGMVFAALLLANTVTRVIDEYRERQQVEQVQRLRAECERNARTGGCRTTVTATETTTEGA